MKIKQIETFKFSELSEKAKEKALEKLCDLNVDHAWWEFVYEYAARSGLKITGFDLCRRRGATGKFILNPSDAAKSFVSEHGEACETRVTSEAYLKDLADLQSGFETTGKALDPEYDLDDDREFASALEDLNADFLRSILEDYSIMLQKEYEYLTSEAAIIESIEANDYDFTVDGKIA